MARPVVEGVRIPSLKAQSAQHQTALRIVSAAEALEVETTLRIWEMVERYKSWELSLYSANAPEKKLIKRAKKAALLYPLVA